MDDDHCIYVCDEANNRIQKFSAKRIFIGAFAFGSNGSLVTDVAYNRATNQLIIPKAYSERGMLLNYAIYQFLI